MRAQCEKESPRRKVWLGLLRQLQIRRRDGGLRLRPNLRHLQCGGDCTTLIVNSAEQGRLQHHHRQQHLIGVEQQDSACPSHFSLNVYITHE